MLQCVLYRFSNPFFLESLLHYIAPFRWSWISVVDCLIHYLSACPIRYLLKPFMSWGNQHSTIHGSSPRKCNWEIWWDALNVVVATIPLVMSGLTPSSNLFLYNMTSSSNVLMTWPYYSVWPLRHDNGFLGHGLTCGTSTLFKFLCPTDFILKFEKQINKIDNIY